VGFFASIFAFRNDDDEDDESAQNEMIENNPYTWDLSKVTMAGWGLLISAAIIGIFVAGFVLNLDLIPADQRIGRKAIGLAGAVVAVGYYLGAKAAMRQMGMSIFKEPKKKNKRKKDQRRRPSYLDPVDEVIEEDETERPVQPRKKKPRRRQS